MADNNNPADIAPNGLQINTRDRLFHAIFVKAASVYIRVVPKWCRGFFEIIVLAKALCLFTTLSYIHFTFSKYPTDCLDIFQDSWPRDGILQIQIIKDRSSMPVKKVELPPYFASKWNNSLAVSPRHKRDQCSIFDQDGTAPEFNASEVGQSKTKPTTFVQTVDDEYLLKRETVFYEAILNTRMQEQNSFFLSFQNIFQFHENNQVKNLYVMEYSLEYGFLRLSQETRKKLGIPVEVVNLDPNKDKCFGDSLSRFILDRFLGYDDLLMASIKKLAEREGNKGYMKNVISGEHYKFVTMWMGRTSYTISFLLMFVFTISISTLLRFCHQQIFIFIIHLFHVMDWNASLAFPVAPMFTVILSLVGMEAIMAEFFNNTTTSFYIILIVWGADQFDSICCHTRLSQKYWLRFFYLYHFLFYAYHYRFNGQYSTIALASSWFFIQHSMLYFLHNYEIPLIEAGLAAQGGNYLDDAVELFVDEIPVQLQPENVVPQDNRNNAEQSGNDVTPVIDTVENEDEPINRDANDQNPVFPDNEGDSLLANDVCIDPGGSEAHAAIDDHGNEIIGEQTNHLDTEASQSPQEANGIVTEDSLFANKAAWPDTNVKTPLNHQTEAGTYVDRSSSVNSVNENEDVSIERTSEMVTQRSDPCQLASSRFCENVRMIETRSMEDPALTRNQHGIAPPSSSEDYFGSSRETYLARQSSEGHSGQQRETVITDSSIHENSNQHTSHWLRTVDITTPIDQTYQDATHIESIDL